MMNVSARYIGMDKTKKSTIECSSSSLKNGGMGKIMMKKRVFMIVSLLLVSGLLLSACGGDSAGDLAEEGKFTFASSGEFRPFSMTKDGVMSGYDIDVGKAIAAELGLEPNPKKAKFATIVEGVKTGRYDAAVASHTITEKRLEAVNFSIPYYYSGPQIFTRPGSDVETADDLKGLEIAVSKGSTYADQAKEYTEQANIKLYDSDVVALEALANGRHDVVITDFITGKEAIGNGLELEGKQLLGRSEQAIAVAKENEELLNKINEALEKLRNDGTLAEISKKYFGEDISSDPEK
jgi:polar amino acid transport system substrate-binding protein